MESDAILRRYTTLPILIDMLVRKQITIRGRKDIVVDAAVGAMKLRP